MQNRPIISPITTPIQSFRSRYESRPHENQSETEQCPRQTSGDGGFIAADGPTGILGKFLREKVFGDGAVGCEAGG